MTTSSGFSQNASNVFETSANFANPAQHGAASCEAFAKVPAGMATAIANFPPALRQPRPTATDSYHNDCL
jgi:hypothetical protein